VAIQPTSFTAERPTFDSATNRTWLPQTLIRDDLASGRLIEVAPQEWTIELEIRLYRDRSPIGKAAEEFWPAVCAAAK
jgi:hypothetical protein